MAKELRHTGRVVAVEQGGEVSISLHAIAACDGCRAKSQCGMSKQSSGESSERLLRVSGCSVSGLSIGDSVEVTITDRVGMIAVLMTYIVPLIVFIVSIVIAITVGLDQGVAGLVGFGALALYYGVLYLLRGVFEQRVHFEVRKRIE